MPVPDIAPLLGLPRTTISRRIAAGEIKTTKVGNRHRITYDELERFWERALPGRPVA